MDRIKNTIIFLSINRRLIWIFKKKRFEILLNEKFFLIDFTGNFSPLEFVFMEKYVARHDK